MHPLDAALLGDLDCLGDKLYTDALTPYIRVNGGIQEKGMNAAIPGEVDKPNQPLILVGANIAQAVAEHLLKIRRNVIRPRCREQRIQHFIRDWRTPTI